MISIDRTMVNKIQKFGEGFSKSQASFNSDGCLTLRMYNPGHECEDVILIFSPNEAKAIFGLFKQIEGFGDMMRPQPELPF